MPLLAGKSLEPNRFFTAGQAVAQGSSFDLTIGCIFDPDGTKVDGIFTLKPGHMVQVVSAEVFRLPDNITGHVTYKTTLTKKGISALTVGIVDPGWTGPVATTLLNFSKVDHAIASGDSFLRVSFFEHETVAANKLRAAPNQVEYLKDIQKTAASMFPPTFLNSDKITKAAGDYLLERIRNQALIWVTLIALLFTVIQVVLNSGKNSPAPLDASKVELFKAELEAARSEINVLRAQLLRTEERVVEKLQSGQQTSRQPGTSTAEPRQQPNIVPSSEGAPAQSSPSQPRPPANVPVQR